jgi:hypothetical protein
MALNFPSSPTNGQIYTDDNSVVWQYDSVKWNVVTGSTKKIYSGVKLNLTSAFMLTSTDTAISWDSESFDTGSYWTVSTPTRLTISQSGYYDINLVLFASNAGAGYSAIVKLNGSTVLSSTTFNANQATEYNETLQLSSGDYIEILVSDSTGSGSITTSSYVELTQMGLGVGTGVSSYSAFSGVRTTLTTDFNTTSTPTAIAWEGTDFNVNANAQALEYWTISTPGRITVKVNGYYQLGLFLATDSSAGTYTITARKNGTTSLASSTLGANDSAQLNQVYYLAADDYIEIMVSNSDSTGAITNESHFEVIRLGYP